MTAIRKTNNGWAAVQVLADSRLRLIEVFVGAGCKARAIAAAGTNRVIA